jgi:hypothetical protein
MDEEAPSTLMGHDFPDLWARLHAQVGHERASSIWRAAGTMYDAMHSEAITE